jgi:hypothetical protein
MFSVHEASREIHRKLLTGEPVRKRLPGTQKLDAGIKVGITKWRENVWI